MNLRISETMFQYLTSRGEISHIFLSAMDLHGEYPNYSYKERVNFLSYKLEVDDVVKPHQCILCNFKTECSWNLRRHHMRHTNERPYSCLKCDYSAREKSNLKKHVLYGCRTIKHARGKFQCEVCDYSTLRKGHLRRHQFCHTGERPFKCSVCDYRAKLKQGLNNHELLHTARKRTFKCHLCDYKAFYKKNLVVHLRGQHVI